MIAMEASPLRQFPVNKKASKKHRRVWRLKVGITWNAIKKALSLATLKPSHHRQVKPLPNPEKKKRKFRPSVPLAYYMKIAYAASDFVDNGDFMTPTKSPVENISPMWQDIHCLHNWESLLDPLHPWLRREILKYGEFAEATYDAFDFDPLPEYCGSCRHNRHQLFEELNLTKHGYDVTKYIYAMSHVDVPSWFERTGLGSTWSKDSNWMGYVCVSNDQESLRIGRRDIVMAWRGTVAPTEWFTDLKSKLQPIGDKKVKVQRGFLTIYTSKSEHTRYNKLSASEQVMQELKRLVKFYRDRGEEVSFTITGHSLGGSLALLNAYEAATTIPDLYVSVLSFGAPRLGNAAFKNRLNDLGVKTLRVVVKQDIVPKLPGWVINEILNKFHVSKRLDCIYRHIETQLKLDMRKSPYLKHKCGLSRNHNLEMYLHLLDGYHSKMSKFRRNARRDITLVNKSTDMLIEELRIPEFWYNMPYKGLVFNKYGNWVKPGRNPEDIPSPHVDSHVITYSSL